MFVLLFLVFLNNITFWKIEHWKPIWGANENIMKSDSHFWIHSFVWISQTVTERLQANQFEHKGDIVTQSILNNFSWRMDFPHCRGQSTPQARLWQLREMLVLLLSGCKNTWWLKTLQLLALGGTDTPFFSHWFCSCLVGQTPRGWLPIPSGTAPGVCCCCGGGMGQKLFSSCRVQSCSLVLLPARIVAVRCRCWGVLWKSLLLSPLSSSSNFCLPL